MTSIGQALADARRKRKVTVKDVEKAIKIRAKYRSALEKDAFDQVPGEAYAVGFLRTYAEWLELDAGMLIERYRHEVAASPKSADGLGEFDYAEDRGSDGHRGLGTVILAVLAPLLAVWIIMMIWPALNSGH